MTRKFLSAGALICIFSLTFPLAGQACDSAEHSVVEREKGELADLNLARLKSEEAHVILYNFRTGRCIPFDKAHTELEVSAFLPSDETAQGMYQEYRSQGKSPIEALEHTLLFMIEEEQS